ncbi:hypothetical protein [Methylomonas albis]|uniref:Uncharacterized protein n=1 Tax=Methylomonas albis TaxID=1854563 RepID=A0ABR9D6T1_9GAMM|nr:hypothetical protein [Methylomonas albis]MBD9358832.1 hypothetical protein [Methylomonas albis]
MPFVIDETSWHFDELEQNNCIEALEVMLDLLDDAHDQGQLACYSEELFETVVWQNKTFYGLYEPDSPMAIPWEVQERVASIFGRLPKWQELDSYEPRDFDVQIDNNGKEFAPSIAWAHEQTIQNKANAVACLVFPAVRPVGNHAVTVNNRIANLWFIGDFQSYRGYFRWLILDTTKNPDEMARFAASAFPSIDFIPDSFNGIKDMSKPYRDLVEPLTMHLSALSDHGKRIFLGSWQNVTAEFGSLGVDITDENGNTKGNSQARRERTINVNGEDVVFWWHSKLEPDRDRIHFSPDKIANGGPLLVGIFCHHLQT